MSGDKSHGGAREGAGRKPKFISDSQSEAIRVPKASKAEIERLIELIDEMVAAGFTIAQIEQVIKNTPKN